MLIMLRHGQTHINAQSLLQGHIDVSLDDVGREQARRCGEFIREHFPDATVISSPLLRARETASFICDDFSIDESFIELNYGQWDGRAMSEIPQELWREWQKNPHFCPPGGESLVELDARVQPALNALIDRASTHDVVVVSHVSPIKSAITWALGVGPDITWRCRLDRASMCRIAMTPRGPSLVSMNETTHLL